MSRLTRRSFLQTSAAFAGASLLYPSRGMSANVLGANDRLRIAVAGLNGRGQSHIDGWLKQQNVEIAYVIDPDQNVLERTLKGIEKRTEGKVKPKGLADVREALDDKGLHALSIATPNHWHSLMTIWAARAGKHVYVEKPMSHDITEGRVVVEAQKKYGVVVQHGTQNRSNAQIAGLHEAIQAGKWGKLKISYGYCCKQRGPIGFKPASAPPPNLNWELWKGPAIFNEYHGNLVHYNWHWFWKSGNGDLNNQGTHQLDVARWALDKDQTHPIRAMALGGRFLWDDQGETPNTMFSMAEYPNGQFVFFNVRNVPYKGYEHQVYNEYYFEDGGKILPAKVEGKGVFKYFAKGSTDGEVLEIAPGKVTPGGNWGSFIAACRANDPNMANGNALDAHYGSVLGHIINNSYRLGTEVPFNESAGKFGDNKDAHEHFMKLHAIMQNGVGVPKDTAKYTVGPWLSFDGQAEKFVGEHADKANVLVQDSHNKGFEVPSASEV